MCRCGACQAVVYCGKDCQKDAWKGHRQACRASVLERNGAILAADAARRVPVLGRHGAILAAAAADAARRHDLDVHRRLHALYTADDHEGVARMRDEAVAVAERMCGMAKVSTSACMYSMIGTAMSAKGRFDEMLDMCERAREAIELHPEEAEEAGCRSQFSTELGVALHNQGRASEAQLMHEQAVEMSLSETPSLRLNALGGLAACFVWRGRRAEAMECHEALEALTVPSSLPSLSPEESARVLQTYAAAVLAFAGAECSGYRRAYGLLERCQEHLRAVPPSSPVHAHAAAGMATCTWNLRRRAESGAERDAALASFRTHLAALARIGTSDLVLRLQVRCSCARFGPPALLGPAARAGVGGRRRKLARRARFGPPALLGPEALRVPEHPRLRACPSACHVAYRAPRAGAPCADAHVHGLPAAARRQAGAGAPACAADAAGAREQLARELLVLRTGPQ